MDDNHDAKGRDVNSDDRDTREGGESDGHDHDDVAPALIEKPGKGARDNAKSRRANSENEGEVVTAIERENGSDD